MPVTHILAYVASAFGGGIGGFAMINPAWASQVVRLVPTPGQVEGKSEFRASFGGLFLLGHAFAAWALASGQPGGELAVAAIAAGWLGAACGRALSFAFDGAMTPLNLFNLGLEVACAMALASPLLFG